jgi:hypothetical protein
MFTVYHKSKNGVATEPTQEREQTPWLKVKHRKTDQTTLPRSETGNHSTKFPLRDEVCHLVFLPGNLLHLRRENARTKVPLNKKEVLFPT